VFRDEKNAKRTEQRRAEAEQIKDIIVKLEQQLHDDLIQDTQSWPEGFTADEETEQRHCYKFRQETNQSVLNKKSCSVCWELHYANTLEQLDTTTETTQSYLNVLKEKGDSGCTKASFSFDHQYEHLDGLPLLESGLTVNSDGTVEMRMCPSCINSLKAGEIPPRSVANQLWIGPQTETMKHLSIPAKLLVSPVRTKCYITKLKGHGNPKNNQRGFKGMSIAYPQLNALRSKEQHALPGTIEDITEYLTIVFVNNKVPTEEVLKKKFSIKTGPICEVLNQWRSNDHPGFKGKTWNSANLSALEEADNAPFKDTFAHCIRDVEEEGNATEASTQSYVDDGKEEIQCQEDITMERCGVVNSNMAGVSLDKKDNSIHVTHDDDPTNTYYNPSYWVNSFPWLFPFGTGGAEMSGRPSKTALTLIEWIRHLLNLEDSRFRQDPAFMFIAFDIVYRRSIYNKTKYVYNKVYSKKDTDTINDPTVDDFNITLKHMNEKSNLGDDPASKRIKEMMKRVKRIGSKVTGSVYDREACRTKIMGITAEMGLPHLFVTINPSDIHNLIVSYWSSLSSEEQFDLVPP